MEEVYSIYFYKNEMLKSIDENIYRYTVCKDKPMKEMLNNYYIKEIDNVKKIKIDSVDKTIMKSFIKRYMKEYTIYEEDISTCIIDENKLDKKLEEIKELIKDRKKVKEYKTKEKNKIYEIEYKTGGELNKIEEEELKEYIKELTRGDGELHIYRYKENDYYSKNLWIYEIMAISKRGRKKDNTVYYVAELNENNYEYCGKSIGIDKRLISIIMYINLKNKEGYYKEGRKIIYGITDNEKMLKDIEELGKGWKDINLKDKEIIKSIIKKIEEYYEMKEGETLWFEEYMMTLTK